MARDTLPSQRVPLAGALIASNEFYVWFQSLERALRDGSSQAEIAALLARVNELAAQVAAIQPGSLIGPFSVDAYGPFADGSYQVQLENDLGDPPASAYYGTDSEGVRGYHALPDAAVLPLTTGEIAGGQPVFVYGPDGRLIYGPVT